MWKKTREIWHGTWKKRRLFNNIVREVEDDICTERGRRGDLTTSSERTVMLQPVLKKITEVSARNVERRRNLHGRWKKRKINVKTVVVRGGWVVVVRGG